MSWLVSLIAIIIEMGGFEKKTDTDAQFVGGMEREFYWGNEVNYFGIPQNQHTGILWRLVYRQAGEEEAKRGCQIKCFLIFSGYLI